MRLPLSPSGSAAPAIAEPFFADIALHYTTGVVNSAILAGVWRQLSGLDRIFLFVFEVQFG